MRRFSLILFLLLATAVSQAQTRELADSLVDYGTMFLGKPYRRAGTGPNSFDCSGFTSYVYRHFGISLPHSSAAQGNVGRAVEGNLTNLQKGDLVLFSGSRISNTIGHVGIFIEMDPSGNSFSFIHAAVNGGVRISHSDEDYYRKRFRAVRRVLPDFEEVVYEKTEDPRDGQVVELPDVKIRLGDGDMQVVLFADGRWSVVDASGVLHSPETESVLTLTPDGLWKTDMKKSSAVSLPGTPQTPAVQDAADAPVYHTIKSGDTLSKIARTYGTTVEKLCELNAISKSSTLHIGQKIKLR